MMALPTRPSVRRGHSFTGADVLIDVDALSKSFTGAAGDNLPVLRSIEQQLRSREIVALLRRCGSAKSTLPRIIAVHLCRRLILQTV